ncbi:uncharacterized protein LOC114525296 [Dendronephthya gigantea]|uniref:uncharacterized protein LOC114525296 n=1 Tax=Dendronephthya gigantea TaxID=151771 RepID=UPI0010693868|nr:uncharacterized protein LOC114525296 [Dendronephthya gigantea]
MTFAAGSIAGHHMMHEMDVVTKVAGKLLEIQHSQYFDRASVLRRPLKLSQAYCLLWQNQETGDVEGRQGSSRKLGGCFFAVLVDLMALGKISLVSEHKNSLAVQVVNQEQTGTYLDSVVFDEMVKYQNKHPTKNKEVSEYILEAVKRDNVDKNCATLTLDSLVEIDILDKEQKMLGLTKKYPTLKFEPENSLKHEISEILLNFAAPDSYMRCLLTILRTSDKLYLTSDPLLSKYFSKADYEKKVKERVDVISNSWSY